MKILWFQRKLITRVLALMACFGMVACASQGFQSQPNSCTSSVDCPGSQICQAQKCVTPSASVEPRTEKTGQDASPTETEPVTELPAEKVSSPEEKVSEKAPPEEPVVEEEPTEEPPEEPACIDKDNDGFCENIKGTKGAIDCDDNNKDIHPDATEICNGKDDDCNGQVDDNLKAPLCSKQEGVCKGAVQTCGGEKGWVDCTDSDYDKHANGAYEAPENSCDGLDNDCNGTVDENFKEKGQDCTDTTKKGECAKGSMTCQNGKLLCVSTTSPQKEICFNSKDDDCNGKVDESPPCTCKTGETESCYDGSSGCTKSGTSYQCTAPCKAGTRTCQSNNQWGPCTNQVQPTTEVCDGKDNNCDGKVDETFTTLGRICTAGVGACKALGKIICDPKDSQKVTCDAAVGKPTTEVCDGIDNDCDGVIDNGLRRVTFYRDADRDGYGDPKVSQTDCKQPSGYVANSTDCYDNNANAKPGQTNYYTTHRGDGSFDYNCDGKAEQRPFKCSSSGCSGSTWSGTPPACGKTGTVVSCKKVFTSCSKYPAGSKTQACR